MSAPYILHGFYHLGGGVQCTGGHTTKITFVRRFLSKIFNYHCIILVHHNRFVIMFKKLAHFQLVLAWNYFYHVGSMLTAVSIHHYWAPVQTAACAHAWSCCTPSGWLLPCPSHPPRPPWLSLASYLGLLLKLDLNWG